MTDEKRGTRRDDEREKVGGRKGGIHGESSPRSKHASCWNVLYVCISRAGRAVQGRQWENGETEKWEKGEVGGVKRLE